MLSAILVKNLRFILAIICYVSWVIYVRKRWDAKNIIAFIFPPILFFKRSKDPWFTAVVFFIVYVYFGVLLEAMKLVVDTGATPRSLIFAIFQVYELLILFFIYSLIYKNKAIIFSVFGIAAAFFIGGVALTISTGIFMYVNIADFIALLIKIGSLFIAIRTLSERGFYRDAEIVFIIFGFFIFFIFQFFNVVFVLENIDIGVNLVVLGGFITYIFWEVSLICIRKIKSAYSG